MKKLLTLSIALLLAIAMNAQTQVWHKQLKVNPKPTVTMADASICENGNILVTFTGIIDVATKSHVFTLNYTIDVTNCSDAGLNGTSKTPASIGLPTVFSLTPTTGQGQLNLVAGSFNNVSKASTYTASIPAGSAGDFVFKFLDITDDNCTNNDPQADVTIHVKRLPIVTVASLPTDLCLGAGIEFTSDVSNTVLNFTTDANDNTLDGTFNFTIPTTGTAATQNSAAIGVFNFTLNKISSDGCEWLVADPEVKIHVVDVNADVTTYSTTVHALPTAEIVETSVCQNGTFTLKFHGAPTFDLSGLTVTGGGFGTFPTSLPVAWLVEAAAADSAGDKDWEFRNISPVDAGTINATGTITDAWGCTSAAISDAITIVPTPTVTFPSVDEICEGTDITLTFTGSDPAFVMDYKITIEPNTTNADLLDPSTIGLPTTFNTTLATAGTPSSTYTATVTGGMAGVFDFYLKSLTNNGCTIYNPDTTNGGYGAIVP